MASASPARPELSPANIQALGRLWDAGLRHQNEALCWLGARYAVDGCENFALLRWEQLGHELQAQIAAEWFTMLDAWRRALR